MKNAEDIFPIYKVEHDTLVSAQGDLTIAYEVRLPELFTLSNEEYLAFHQTWVKAIKLLPKHSIFHKQDWFVEDHYSAKFTNQTFLGHASERFFNERPFLAHRCYIYLTKRPVNHKMVNSAASGLMRKRLTPPQSTDKDSRPGDRQPATGSHVYGI